MKKSFLLSAAVAAVLASPVLAKNPLVEVDTNQGSFTIELYQEKAPKTVENFIAYVKDGSYVGTQFHRVIPGFVVQGGGYDANFLMKATRSPIKNESKPDVKNLRGTLSMARTQNPDSATRQFFINIVDNAFLDAAGSKPGYAVFGAVSEGFDTITKIASVETSSNKLGMRDVPLTPIVIEKIEIKQ